MTNTTVPSTNTALELNAPVAWSEGERERERARERERVRVCVCV